MTTRDLPATVPIGRTRRHSREFMAVGVPLTPALERLHSLDTARLPKPLELTTTGRVEERYARRIRRQQTWSRVLGMGAVVLATLIGLGFGCLLAAVAKGGV